MSIKKIHAHPTTSRTIRTESECVNILWMWEWNDKTFINIIGFYFYNFFFVFLCCVPENHFVPFFALSHPPPFLFIEFGCGSLLLSSFFSRFYCSSVVFWLFLSVHFFSSSSEDGYCFIKLQMSLPSHTKQVTPNLR